MVLTVNPLFAVNQLDEWECQFSPQTEDDFIKGEIIVWFNDDVTENEINVLNSSYGTEIKEISLVTPERMILVIPEGEERRYVDLYNDLSIVRVASINRVVTAAWSPNDTYYSYQWHFNKPSFIYLEDAWNIEQGGNSSVSIAILDTGVAYENYSVPSYEQSEVVGSSYNQAPDLAGTVFSDPYDFVHNDTHPNDQNGHGTHVCGTVAQTTNNSLGVAGMAFNCTIIPVQVLNYQGSGSSFDLADGIDWARTHGADVMNMSLSSSSPMPTVEAAIEDAYNSDIVVVAATGNNGNSSINYPAKYSEVIAVGSVQYDATRSPYSNYGTGIELVAPGGNTSVDQNGDGFADGVLQMTYEHCNDGTNLADVTSFSFWFWQGTSMASPHVAGLVGLMISHGAGGVEDIRTMLHGTATDLGSSGYDTEYGYGLINCLGALSSVTIGTEPDDFGTNSWDLCAVGNPSHDGQYSIRITAPVSESAAISIYDVSGRMITTTLQILDVGEQTIHFNGLSNGIYFCHVNADNFNGTQRFVVLD